MKKLMIASAAALCAAVGFGEIASANVVGYSQDTFEANNNFHIGAQFESIIASDASITVDQLVKPSDVGAWGDGEDDSMGKAPKLMVWTGGGYKYFYYISDATYDEDQEYASVGHDCWADRDGIILSAEDAMTIGEGAWIRFQNPEGSRSLTFNGQVDGADTFTVSVWANNNKVVCNPFPVKLDFAKVVPSDGLNVGAWGDGEDDTMGNAPKMMVWTGGGYKYFYFISDATYDEDQGYAPVGKNCWADRDGIILPESEQIGVGRGFWIRATAEGSLTFTK